MQICCNHNLCCAYPIVLDHVLLRQQADQNGSDRIAHHVDRRAESVPATLNISNCTFDVVTLIHRQNLQQPVDRNYDRHVLGGQTDGVQHHHHGDQTGLRNAGGTDRRSRRRHTVQQQIVSVCIIERLGQPNRQSECPLT